MFTGIVQVCGAVASAARPALELPLETLAQGMRLKIDSVRPLGADWRGNTWSWARPESRPEAQSQTRPQVQTQAATGPVADAATGTAANTATGLAADAAAGPAAKAATGIT